LTVVADPLDFAKMAKSDFGIEAVEYVNQFFPDKAQECDVVCRQPERL
jgi:hypothetical protein